MASTYSTDLRIELMANGENSNTWGTKTNTNWNLVEQAVAGVASVAITDADYTLVATNGVADEARNAVITITGTTTQSRNVIVPSVDKNYTFKNSTTGGYNIVVKTAAGSGITIPNGATAQVYCDATNVLAAITHVGTLTVTTLNGHTFTAGSSTFTGTAAQTYTFPTTSATLARTDAANTFTGTQTMGTVVVTTLNGHTFTTGSSTFTGTAAQTYTFPTTSATLARTDAANTFTGTQTIGALTVTTVNGNTITTGTSTFTGTAGQTYTFPTTSATLARTDSPTFTGTTTTAAIAMGNNNLTGTKCFNWNGVIANATTSGAVTINWTNGNAQSQAEPTGTITYTFTAPAAPCHLQLYIISDGTSTAQTITWPGTVIWIGATWTATANKKAIINFWYDGTNYYAQGANQV